MLSSALVTFVASGVERREAEQLVALQQEALATAQARPALAALDAADAEDALSDALDDAGIADGWRYAEPLARAGVDAAYLARLTGSPDRRPTRRSAGSPPRSRHASSLRSSPSRRSA